MVYPTQDDVTFCKGAAHVEHVADCTGALHWTTSRIVKAQTRKRFGFWIVSMVLRNYHYKLPVDRDLLEWAGVQGSAPVASIPCKMHLDAVHATADAAAILAVLFASNARSSPSRRTSYSANSCTRNGTICVQAIERTIEFTCLVANVSSSCLG